MAENDRRESAPQVKPNGGLDNQNGKSKKLKTAPKRNRRVVSIQIEGPLWEPDRWYQAEYIWKERLRCSARTWRRYIAAGLKVFNPGTRGGVVWSTDLDKYIRMPDSELPKTIKSGKTPKRKAKGD